MFGMRRPVAALLALASALFLTACGHGVDLAATAVAGSAHAVLNIDWGTDPPGLNPITTDNNVSFDVLNQVMEGLTRLNAQGVPQPGIAASWGVGARGLTYTFHLRHALWSNGDPVQAGDFVYAWRQALDPRNAAQDASELQYIAGASALLHFSLPDPKTHPTAYAAAGTQISHLEAALGVRAPNPQTLVVTLARPTPFWLPLTSLPVYFPADQSRVMAWGMGRYGSNPQYMSFDGPFVISAWVHNQYLDLKKNPKYWDAAHVQLAGVHGVMVSSAATVDNLYQTDQLDVLPSIPPQFLSEYRGKPGFHSTPLAQVWYLQVNVNDPAFKNVLIRRAFSEAIDRAAFASKVVPGSTPAYALTPPTVDYAPGRPFSPLVGHVLPPTADPALARRDLADGLKALGLTVLPRVTLLLPSSSTTDLEAAALQGMFQQNMGVSVQVESVDFKTFLQLMQQGRYSMVLAAWGADYNDPTTFLDLFTAHSPFNTIHWSDPAYNADMQAAQSAPDAERRGADLAAAEKELLAQLPVIPLYWPTRNWTEQPGVRGIVFYLTGPDYSLKGVTKSR